MVWEVPIWRIASQTTRGLATRFGVTVPTIWNHLEHVGKVKKLDRWIYISCLMAKCIMHTLVYQLFCLFSNTFFCATVNAIFPTTLYFTAKENVVWNNGITVSNRFNPGSRTFPPIPHGLLRIISAIIAEIYNRTDVFIISPSGREHM